MLIDPEKHTAKTILEAVGLNRPRMLEIGCGDGRLSRDLLPHCAGLTGVDPDLAALATARERLPAATFLAGSGEALGLAGGVFELVLFSLSLHHLNNRRAALAEAVSALSDGGCIVVLEPLPDSEISAICNLFEDESAALARAESELQQSGLPILQRRLVETRWEFTDRRELHHWLGRHYRTDPGSSRTAAIDRLLRNKITDTPLQIEDTLALTVLLPASRSTAARAVQNKGFSDNLERSGS